MIIYKILRKSEWDVLNEQGASLGAPIDVRDGFVHFSTQDQVAETASKHFSGETGLVLVAVDASPLKELKWEPSRGGALFPHLFRELRMTDVAWHREIGLKDSIHDLSELP